MAESTLYAPLRHRCRNFSSVHARASADGAIHARLPFARFDQSSAQHCATRAIPHARSAGRRWARHCEPPGELACPALRHLRCRLAVCASSRSVGGGFGDAQSAPESPRFRHRGHLLSQGEKSSRKLADLSGRARNADSHTEQALAATRACRQQAKRVNQCSGRASIAGSVTREQSRCARPVAIAALRRAPGQDTPPQRSV